MSCKKQTEIIEKSKVTKLSFKEVVALKFHLSLCPSCSDYKKLSDQLDDVMTHSFSDADHVDIADMKMSDESKEALIKLLKDI